MPLDRQTIAHDPIHEQHLGHGNTVASWAMFTIMFVGFLDRRRDPGCRHHRRSRSEGRWLWRGRIPYKARLTL